MMRYLTQITIVGLLILLASCNKESQQIPSQNPELMSFAPKWQQIGDVLTRGTPVTDGAQMTDMGVFAYYTGSKMWDAVEATATSGYMHNQRITQSGGVWSYSPVKYWPKGNTTLFAYAPYAGADNGITVQSNAYSGAPTIVYTLPVTCANQPDLMVAVKQQDKSSAQVTFPMKHALACVGFKVKGSYQEKITKIAVKGVSVSGTLSLNQTTGGVSAWSDIATATDTEYTSGVKADFIADGTMADAMNVDGYLMMIPQTLGNGAKLIVTVDGQERQAKLDGAKWEAGKRYIYNLDITHPIIIGYFGGWNNTNKVYTKLLQVDWGGATTDPRMKWSKDQTVTKAANKHYGPININILKGLGSDLSNYPAAQYCYLKNDKNKDGFVKAEDGETEEWYLPSQNQLMAIWIAHEGITKNFLLDINRYWSATENSSDYTWFGHLRATNYDYKTNDYLVRCVRDVTP